jgi:sterol desaturase/sphingolipid hydroxylase (fatty acid hydroxylase superfamily)
MSIETIRLAIFLSVFALVAAAEWRFPQHARVQTRGERWLANFGILIFDVVAVRLTVGAAAYGAAVYAQAHGWGLFNSLDWPLWLEGLTAFLILDLAIYLQHVATHAVPVLWRLHKVHHTDLDVDASTGIRFHPGEIILSLVWKAALVAALGVSPWTVVVYETVLNAASVYTHGNIRISARVDHALRWLFCTPDMHRIHHSVIPIETNSNYGNFLSVWDRLFGTMRRNPAKGQTGVEIGLNAYRDPAELGLLNIVAMPFRSDGRNVS